MSGVGLVSRAIWRYRVEVIVFGLAFLARLAMVLTGGGLGGNLAYDGAVYYAAADGLTFGRLPYRNFVLVHPPGSMLALTPFAVIGRLTTDHRGFVLAVLATMVVGAVNAVLVVRISCRMGLGRGAAALGGAFYAMWCGSVASEYVIRLEPLGNLCMLTGLLVYLRMRTDSRANSKLVAAACGACFAAAACVKIWWAVPLALLLVWCAAHSPRRRAAWVALGAGVAGGLIDGPFFAAAPRSMLNMVVLDQLGRPRAVPSLTGRLPTIVGLSLSHRYLGSAGSGIAVVVLCLAFLVIMVRASRVQAARFVVALAVAQAAVLLMSPSWYSYYADFLAPALAVAVAAAANGVELSRPRRLPYRIGRLIRVAGSAVVVATVAADACALAYYLAVGPNHADVALPSARLQTIVRSDYCVMSDSPMGLILSDSLSRDFAHGCADWVDVTGRSLGVDAVRAPDGVAYARRHNVKWQRDLLRYLRSGEAALVVRQPITGMTAATLHALGSAGRTVAGAHYSLFDTPHGRAHSRFADQ